MSSTKSMTSGSPGKLILAFALPLMLGNIFQQCYTIADAAIVGQALGIKAIASIGAAEGMVYLVVALIQGLTQGFSIQIAQEFGAEKYDKLRNVVYQSIVQSAVSAAVVMGLGLSLSVWVLNILNTPGDIFGDSHTYLTVILVGLPVVTAYNMSASILRALGDGKTPLYAMVAASLINIGLDILFVVGLHMGVFGAALATVIAQVCSAIICIVKITRIEILHFHKEDLKVTGKMQGQLFKLGMPMAFQNVIIAIGTMVLQSVINVYGVTFIAGLTATNKLYGLLEVAATSYGFAMTTYTGQNLGAQKIDRIVSGYRVAMLIAAVTSLIITAVMVIFGRQILMLFISGEPGMVKETLDIAYHYLFIMSVSLVILYYLHVTRSCIQGMGNTVLPMVSGFAEFIMRTAAAFLLPVLLGQEGIFFAEIAAWLGADIVLCISYYYCLNRIKQQKKAA